MKIIDLIMKTMLKMWALCLFALVCCANVDAKNVKLIIVTNPLDVMVMLAQEISKLPALRVIGTGTMLDSARLRTILSRQLSVSTQSINAYVLGEHGDSSMIAWSSACVGGIDLNSFCRQTKISLPQTTRKTIEHRVHNAAYEIIQGRGATWDGIAGAVADLVRFIANDERRFAGHTDFDLSEIGKKLDGEDEEEAPAEPPAPPAPSAEEVLLTEIRDLLKAK